MRKFSLLLATPLIFRIILLLPILVFATFFFSYSINVPWFDDFESIPYFLQRALDLPTWQEKIEALLRPNNEHRVVYARLVVWMYYQLTGTINFQALMLIGNSSFLVILFLFYRSLRKANLPIRYLLPVPFLLLNAQNQLLTFTALFTLQYLAIIMLVFLSVYQLAKNTVSGFVSGILLAFLTTFSMGNGMLVWVAGIVILFYQRQWQRLGIWVVLMAAAIYLYFYGYPVQQGNQEGFTFMKDHFLQIISGFFVFVGSLFDLVPRWPLLWRSVVPFVAGVVMVVFLAVWSFQILFQDTKTQKPTHWNAFLLGCIVFLICNAVIVALFRTRFGFEMMLWGSYRAYAMVLAAVTYLIFIGSRRTSVVVRENGMVLFLLLAAGIAFSSYLFGIPIAADNRNLMQAKVFNQRYNQIGLGGSYNTNLGDFIASNIDVMQNRGWYKLPQPGVSADEKKLFEPVSGTITKADWTVTNTADLITVTSQDAVYKPDNATTLYLILKSESRTYLWYTTKRRPSLYNPLVVAPGFTTYVPPAMLKPGSYRLGVFEVQADGRTHTRYTDRFVTVE